MDHSGQYKVVILETDKAQRDYLRSIVSTWGYTPFIFEKETICLDNLSPLNPDLVISGSLPVQRTCRFINTIKIKNFQLPIMIISSDEEIRDYIGTNGFADRSAGAPLCGSRSV